MWELSSNTSNEATMIITYAGIAPTRGPPGPVSHSASPRVLPASGGQGSACSPQYASGMAGISRAPRRASHRRRLFPQFPRACLLTSPGSRDTLGVHRHRRRRDSSGVPSFATHGAGSICGGFLWNAAPGQPSGGGGDRGVSPRGKRTFGQAMPTKAITLAKDETFTGGLAWWRLSP